MSDLTAELNLALAVDNDDTADYLVTTGGLRGSLTTIDGLFNATTGHNHNGAHQGGAITTLTLSGGLTVNGPTTLNSLDVTTTSHLRGAVTADATLAVAGTTTLTGTVNPSSTLVVGQSLQVNLDLNVARNASIGGALGITGGLTVGGNLQAGDIIANRGANAGYLFLGTNQSHYYGFDGANYQIVGAPVYIQGDRAVTETATETLSNKTLSGPTLSGTVSGTPTWASAQQLPQGSRVGGLLAVVSQAGSAWHLDGGYVFLQGGPGQTVQAQNFNAAYTAAPTVVITMNTISGGRGTYHTVAVAVDGVGTNGFNIVFDNQSGSQQSLTINWMAFGT